MNDIKTRKIFYTFTFLEILNINGKLRLCSLVVLLPSNDRIYTTEWNSRLLVFYDPWFLKPNFSNHVLSCFSLICGKINIRLGSQKGDKCKRDDIRKTLRLQGLVMWRPYANIIGKSGFKHPVHFNTRYHQSLVTVNLSVLYIHDLSRALCCKQIFSSVMTLE